MIAILPDSHHNILVFRASKKLTGNDYETVFIPELNQLIQVYGKIRAVLYLDENFEGWEIEAMWDDAKFGITHRNDFEKIAIVGGPAWMEWATAIGSHLIDGQVKTFPEQSLSDAIAWASL